MAMDNEIKRLQARIGDILTKQGLRAVRHTEDGYDPIIYFENNMGHRSLVTFVVRSGERLEDAAVSVGLLVEEPEIFDGWKFIRYEGIEHVLFPRQGDAIAALREQLIMHAGEFDLSEGFHNKVQNHPLTPVTLAVVKEVFSSFDIRCRYNPFATTKESGEGFLAITPDGTEYRLEMQNGGCLLSIDDGEKISFKSGTGSSLHSFALSLNAYLTSELSHRNPMIIEEMSLKMDQAFSKWLPMEEVHWKADTLLGPGEMERLAFAIDPEREQVTIVRGWMSGGEPMVSVDLEVPFHALQSEFNEMTFPHSILGKQHTRLSKKFVESFENQQVEILWHHEASELQGFYIARTAKPGRGDRLAIGLVQVLPDGQLQVLHDYDENLEKLSPKSKSALRM